MVLDDRQTRSSYHSQLLRDSCLRSPLRRRRLVLDGSDNWKRCRGHRSRTSSFIFQHYFWSRTFGWLTCCLQLVICCVWTFCYQVIVMSYYVFSAELPSALLRGKFSLLVTQLLRFTNIDTVKTGPITFFFNSITGIATWYVSCSHLNDFEKLFS
jgi:hypothetical protein